MCDTREEKEKTRRGVTETRRKDTMFVCIWMCGFVCVCVCVYNRGERPLIAAAEAADQIRSRRALKCLIGNCVCECVCVCASGWCYHLTQGLEFDLLSHTHTHTHTHTQTHIRHSGVAESRGVALLCNDFKEKTRRKQEQRERRSNREGLMRRKETRMWWKRRRGK